MWVYQYCVKNSSTTMKHVKNMTDKAIISIQTNIIKPSLLILKIWDIVHYLQDLYQKFTMDCVAAMKNSCIRIQYYNEIMLLF